VAGLPISNIADPAIESENIKVGEEISANQYKKVINGIRFDVVEFDTHLYPARAGQIFIDPITISCDLLYRSSQRSSLFGGGSGFFDDDLFDSFFNNYQRRPITVKSKGHFLEVLPLPAGNRPDDFSGSVGRFKFDVEAGPLDLNEGDPITLKMVIQGEGYLTSANLPSLEEDKSFKVYDPQITDLSGSKSIEQVIIPKSNKVTKIPAISFSYFDPQKGIYQTISKGPIAVQVKESQQGGLKIVGASQEDSLQEEQPLGQDIVYIKDEPGRFYKKNKYVLYRRQPFLFFVILYILFVITAYFIYKRKLRLETDVGYARRLKAPRKAKVGLQKAKHYLEKSKEKEFFDVIFKTLQEYLANKYHLPKGGISIASLDKKLGSRVKKQEDILKLKNIFELCDSVRYASLGHDKKTMIDVYRNTEEIINTLEG